MRPEISSGFARARRAAKRFHICTRCLTKKAERKGKRWLTKCSDCNQHERDTAPARLRKKYKESDAAGLCVRCNKNAQQDTNKRCEPCEANHQKIKKASRKDA